MRKIPVLIVLTLLSFFSVTAQKTDSALTKLSAQFPVEKIYLHYDKEYYVAGETIWFKAYLFSNGKPSGISNNVIVQFLDSKGRVVANNYYPVTGAVAKGNILVPDSLPQGNYYIRRIHRGC